MDHLLTQVNIANGSSMNMFGTSDLLSRLSGNSVKTRKGGQGGSHTRPVMDYWYPACAAIFANMSQPFIISASLLCSHQMQTDYSDNPELIVVQPIEVEKKFPFLRRPVYHAG